jgi:hypothetical protein
MRRSLATKLSALVAAAALALAIPTIGQANQGGVPHSTSSCPSHHSGKHKGSSKGKKKGSSKGKKCGTA